MVKSRSTDFTKGSIFRNVIWFALPVFAGQFLQNLYNSVDSIVVGRYAGTSALAAVSTSIDVAFLIVSFFNGLSVGAGIVFSRYFGAKDEKGLHDAIHTAISFSLVIGVLMAGLGILLTPFLLRIMACPEDAFGGAVTYLQIYLVGVFFTSVYNMGSSIMRAVGNSRTPLLYLMLACILNVLLDFVLTGFWGMKEAGVAIATVIAQGVSAFMVFYDLSRIESIYQFFPSHMMLNKKVLKEIVFLGIPAGIQGSLTACSNFFVQRYINAFGSAAIAGVGAAKKIDRFAQLTSMSIGAAVTTFVGQNLGAKKVERAFQGIRSCLVIDLTAIVLLGIPVYLFAPYLIGLFDNNPETVMYGVDMVRTIVPLFFTQSLNQIFSNATRGFGKSHVVMVLSLIGMIGCRQIWLAVSMFYKPSIWNIYIAFPLGWAFSALFVLLYFYVVIFRPYQKKTFHVK